MTTSSTSRQRSPGVERRPLDAALEAVLLGLLAHEERLHVGAAGERGARDGVRAHRQAADGGGAPLARPARRRSSPSAREARRAQDRPLGVDVVLRGRAAGERRPRRSPARARAARRSGAPGGASIGGAVVYPRVLERALRTASASLACLIVVARLRAVRHRPDQAARPTRPQRAIERRGRRDGDPSPDQERRARGAPTPAPREVDRRRQRRAALAVRRRRRLDEQRVGEARRADRARPARLRLRLGFLARDRCVRLSVPALRSTRLACRRAVAPQL